MGAIELPAVAEHTTCSDACPPVDLSETPQSNLPMRLVFRPRWVAPTGVLLVMSIVLIVMGVSDPGRGPMALGAAVGLICFGALAWIIVHRSDPARDRDHDWRLRTTSFTLAPKLMTRRRALRMIGVSALVGAPAGVWPRILEGVFKGPTPSASSPGSAVAAQQDFARVRQWAMIIDLRRCDGCQSVDTPPQCTTACVEGHFAPEPMEWIEVYEQELQGEGSRFIPTPCQQCQNPPCVNVCPVGATFSTPEGLVLIDQDRCIGCRICMAACPYDRRFFNWGEPPVPEEAHLARYDIEVQAPALVGTVMKCDFCPDMIRAGTLPYCVLACPHSAIFYGDLEEDVATNGSELIEFSDFIAEHDAFLLKEELGTQPRVFYVPGHGDLVGRHPTDHGRLPTRWPWTRRAEGSDQWSR